jgi:hypothetical protein
MFRKGMIGILALLFCVVSTKCFAGAEFNAKTKSGIEIKMKIVNQSACPERVNVILSFDNPLLKNNLVLPTESDYRKIGEIVGNEKWEYLGGQLQSCISVSFWQISNMIGREYEVINKVIKYLSEDVYKTPLGDVEIRIRKYEKKKDGSGY